MTNQGNLSASIIQGSCIPTYYFTSFKEGWRTERGMIYTIYGPPDKVYKNSKEKAGDTGNLLSNLHGEEDTILKEDYLFFNFRVRENIFSDNDFYLSRSETLVTYWDKAIASWRKGIVFRLDNPEDLLIPYSERNRLHFWTKTGY